VNIPNLVPEINFFPPQKHPLFKVVAVLGIAPDLFITDQGYEPSDKKYKSIRTAAESSTPWIPATNESPATTLEVKLPSSPPDHACAFLLSIGVRFGVPDGEAVRQTRHAGCARILSVIGNNQ